MKKRKKNPNFVRIFFFGVKKSKFANRLKRALPKFRGDRSEVRGVNGRFAVAAVRPPAVENYLEAPLLKLVKELRWEE